MVDVEKLRKVKQCIDSLAEGLNPFTGQPLPEEDIVNDVRVSRSLFLASAFLQEQMQGKTEKKNGKKQAFRLSLEERDRVEFSFRPISASELARRMNNAAGAQDCKKITYRQITDWLVEVGMLKLVENVAGTQRRPTESGKKMGIFPRKLSPNSPKHSRTTPPLSFLHPSFNTVSRRRRGTTGCVSGAQKKARRSAFPQEKGRTARPYQPFGPPGKTHPAAENTLFPRFRGILGSGLIKYKR